MKIEEIPITIIKPYWRNPRKNDKTIEVLKESITKFGFNVPLVLDSKYVIITGHARYKALLQLGYDVVPCVVSDMDEKKAREYRLSDNKISELTEWDEQTLRSEARELQMIIGFDDDELADLLVETTKSINYMDYVSTDVSKANDDIMLKHERSGTANLNSFTTITCPHCGNGFDIKKD